MRNRLKRIIKNIPIISGIVKRVYDNQQESNLQKRIDSFLKSDRLPFTKKPPTVFSVGHEPTIRCNLRCKMCYQGQTRNLRQDELKANEVIVVYNKLKDRVKSIKIVGGEPMVRQDIFDMLKFWDDLNVRIILQSNCTLINENNISKLKSIKNLADIATSLDGPQAVHDEIRGVPGTFDRLKNAIELLQKERNDIIITIFGMLLFNDDLNNTYKLIDICKSLGISTINLLFEQVYTQEEEKASKNILENVLKWKEGSYRLNTQLRENLFPNNINADDLKCELTKIRNYGIKKKCLVNFTPFSYYDKINRYLSLNPGRAICRKLLNPEFRINQKGEVIWCDVIEKSFGNLLEKSPDEIWLSNDFQDFRKFLKKQSLPICKRCCKAVYI